MDYKPTFIDYLKWHSINILRDITWSFLHPVRSFFYILLLFSFAILITAYYSLEESNILFFILIIMFIANILFAIEIYQTHIK